MLNYSLEVFDAPDLLQIYSNTAKIMLCFNSLSFLYMIYVIVFHAGALGEYKWLILTSIVLSYSVDLFMTLAHLVDYLPAYLFYFDGILGKFISGRVLVTVYVDIIGIKLSFIEFLIFFRYARCIPGKLQVFIENPKN